MLTPLGVVLLAVIMIAAWQSWTNRRNLHRRIKSGWGRPRKEAPDMEGIADLFRALDRHPSLDDRTWNDLLLDDVFAELDRTESSVGQQVLYCRLRSASASSSLEAFEALVARFSADPKLRARCQLALTRLRRTS